MKRRIGTFFIAVFFAAGNAYPSDEVFDFFKSEAEVVTAAKHPQKISRVPAAAYVLSAEEISLYGYRTLGEALQSIPGFYVINDRNYTYLWVRGFGRPGDYNSRVLVMINGHRINENSYGGAYLGHDFNLDIRAVDRIEVVKGPGSALYGDSAFFAVVNVFTKRPSASPEVFVDASGGSYGTNREFFSWTQPVGPRGGIFAAGSYRWMEGQDLSYPEFGAINGGIAENADREESYTGFASFTRDGLSIQGNSNGRRKRIPTASFGTRFNDPGSWTVDARRFLETKLERPLGGAVNVYGRVYADHYRYVADYVYDGPFPETRLVNRDLAESEWYGEETRLSVNVAGEENVFLVGQEFEKNVEGLLRNHDVEPYALYTDVHAALRRWAVFFQQELKPARFLSLTAGGRYDHYQSFGKSVNPRAAVIVQPNRRSSFKLLYGRAFRAPSVYEMFLDGIGYRRNPQLRPERITTYEARWERRLAGGGPQLSAGYYRSDVHDLISQTVDPSDGSLVFQNMEEVLSKGGEFEARWDVSSRLSARLGYIGQSTREIGGGRLSNSPRHSGVAGLSRRFSTWRASLGLETFYVGRRTSYQNTRVPGDVVISLNAALSPWEDGPRFTLGVYNLTNTSSLASGDGGLVQATIPQDGRNFQVGVEYKFRP
ncbi:MAG TPA: TonB-dependent receptor [Elusimicrobiota bacterium]|nr:TonB-dependent receptor [Elusimicrobiota bacterium]